MYGFPSWWQFSEHDSLIKCQALERVCWVIIDTVFYVEKALNYLSLNFSSLWNESSNKVEKTHIFETLGMVRGQYLLNKH